MSNAPALSVVVAASDSAAAVARTLESLRAQLPDVPFEVIVAAPFQGRLEGVTWVVAAPGTGVPRLRRLGFDRATASVVAFTEDSCVVSPGWVAAWIQAFEESTIEAATGPVEPGMGDSCVDWSVFFCEYAPFLRRGSTGFPPPVRPAVPAGLPLGRHSRPYESTRENHGSGNGSRPTKRLAGNNFAVRRDSPWIQSKEDVHEMEVAGAILARRGLMREVGPAAVRHVRRYSPRQALGDRLRFGREFGRLREAHRPLWFRPLTMLSGPAILAVQAARLTAIVLGERCHLGRFLQCLPITLALLCAWSAGEWWGGLTAPLRRPGACRPRETEDRLDAPGPRPSRSRRSRCKPARPSA